MIFLNPWLIVAMVAVNLIMTLMIVIKIRKQEEFQTGEAHANLELINQSRKMKQVLNMYHKHIRKEVLTTSKKNKL